MRKRRIWFDFHHVMVLQRPKWYFWAKSALLPDYLYTLEGHHVFAVILESYKLDVRSSGITMFDGLWLLW